MTKHQTRSIEADAPRGAARDLITLNVIVFVLQHVFGIFSMRYADGSIAPMGALSLEALSSGRFHTLLTHLFVHQNLLHLVGNMVMVHFAGKLLQGTSITNRDFIKLYFFAGIGAGLLELMVGMLTGTNYSLIGASGAAFGLALAAVAVRPREPITAMIFFVLPINMRLQTLGKTMVWSSLALGVIQMLGIYQMGIAHFAHLGGALLGYFMARRLGIVELPESTQVSPPPMPGAAWNPWSVTPRPSYGQDSVIEVPAEVVSMPDREGSILKRYGCSSLQDFVERVLRPLLRKREFFGDESLSEHEKNALEEGRWLMQHHGHGTV